MTWSGRAAREPRLLGVLHDPVADALDERVRQPLLDRVVAPGEVAPVGAARAARRRGDLEQPLRGVGPAHEHEVLDALAQLGIEVVDDRQRPGVDDGHVEAGLDGVEEEDGVDGLAHGVVAAEGERDVRDAAAGEDAGQLRLDAPHGLEVGDGVAGVLLHAGADGEDVGVEDDVLGLEAGLVGQQPVGAGARWSSSRSTVSAWPCSSKAMTTTAAPYRRASRAWRRNSASPSLSETEFTIGRPWAARRPASMTDHFDESMTKGTRQMSGSAASRRTKRVMAASESSSASSMLMSSSWAPLSTCWRATATASA